MAEWRTTSLVLDQFERLAQDEIRSLKEHYHRIQDYEKNLDIQNLTLEKNRAKRLVDVILEGYRKVLAKRQQLAVDEMEAFDRRIQPIQQQTQAIINAITSLINKPLPSPPEEVSGSGNNMFSDCFADDRDTYGGIGAPQQQTASEYESEFKQATLTEEEKRLETLKIRTQMAKEDAEATKKLSQDIDDLNQVMTDLATLVHCQHDLVDSIEEHVEQASEELRRGNQQLKKAVAYKNAEVPLAAAAVGATVVGGPVAWTAGSAVLGVVAGIGGAVAGLFGGRMVKKQAQHASEGPSSSS